MHHFPLLLTILCFIIVLKIEFSDIVICRKDTGRHRVVEDKFLQQKARLLRDEAASWSLLWYLFGKGNHSLTLFEKLFFKLF